MVKTKKIPELRFKRFTDFNETWAKEKLGTFATLKARIGWQGLTQKEFLNDGEFYLITGTDFDNGMINFADCYYISKSRYDQDTNIQVKNGDVLITKDGTIGKVAYIKNMDKPATLNAGVFVIKGKDKNLSNLYLYQYLAGPFLLDYADKQATGGTIKHLNQNVLVNFPIPLPSVAEQTQIGSFFQNLDALTALHQRKHDKLSIIKKAMLEKMFPKEGADVPEIRFTGFMEKWERSALGEVARFRRGSFPQPYGNKEWYGGDGAMPFVQVIDVTETLSLVESTKQKISTIAQAKSVFVEKGKIVVTLQGSIGRVAIVQYDAYVDRTLLIFEEFKRKLDAQFWAYTIQQKFEIEKKKAPGGTIKTITKAALSVFEILLPVYEEQTKIGAFFQHLDTLISIHQRELNKLKNIKKACLEKMFV